LSATVKQPGLATRVRLGDVLRLRKEIVHPRDNPSGPAVFVGLEHIESGTGRRIGQLEIEKSSLTGRKPVFKKGDIVYGYLRPYLNKVWVADFDGLCSVDQYVYSVDAAAADPHFIAWFLRSPVFLGRAPIARSPGQLPRIRTEEVAAVLVDLPRLADQHRIVELLSEQMMEVERARAAAEARLKAANALRAALLRQALRELEARTIDRVALGQVSSILAIQVDPKQPKFGALSHVSGENIESGTGQLSGVKTAAEDRMISPKYLFQRGDVLYSKLRPYLRKVTVVDFDGVCSADIYPLRVQPERLTPEFLAWNLLGERFTQYAKAESARARMPKLNREQLMKWQIALPSHNDQETFVSRLRERMNAVIELTNQMEPEIKSFGSLPSALLRRAFSGEL
jgi:type I restriction enzyme S subunit